MSFYNDRLGVKKRIEKDNKINIPLDLESSKHKENITKRRNRWNMY